MRRGKTYGWIPLWVDKWLWGSTRHELAHDERAIFTDLLALAAKDDGWIRANPETPYPLEQLAGMLCAPVELIKRTIEKAKNYGKLSEPLSGIFLISSWEGYRLTDRRKRDLEAISEIAEPISENAAPLSVSVSVSSLSLKVKEIISYLNTKANRRYRDDSASIKDIIIPRLKEGRTVEEFKKIIDIKVAKWGGDPKMDDFLRPSTLFRKSHFDEYLNEKPAGAIPKPDDFNSKLDAWARGE